MTQTSNRFYDQFARLMNDAAGVAQGVRREAETLFRGQADRFVSGMELVRREDFEVVREMAVKAREENGRLEARIAALEARLAMSGAPASSEAGPSVAVPKSRARRTKSGGETAAGKPVKGTEGGM